MSATATQGCVEMNCSGIGRAQLVEELRAYELQLRGDVDFFAVNVGWHGRAKLDAVEAELQDVHTFLASLVAAPEKAAQSATNRPRCPHYKSIRRTFAIAKDCGLNVKDEAAMRRAFGRALGRQIETREELNGNDWEAVGNMMRRGALTW